MKANSKVLVGIGLAVGLAFFLFKKSNLAGGLTALTGAGGTGVSTGAGGGVPAGMVTDITKIFSGLLGGGAVPTTPLTTGGSILAGAASKVLADSGLLGGNDLWW